MKVFGSIRARFTGWYLVVLAVLLITMSVGTYLVLRNALNTNLDEAIIRRAEELMRQPDFIAQLLDERYQPPLGEVVGLFTPSGNGWSAIGQRLPSTPNLQATLDRASTGAPSFATMDTNDEASIRYVLVRYTPATAHLTSSQELRTPPPPGQRTPPQPVPPALEEAVLLVGRPTNVLSALAALRNTLLLAVPLTLLLSAGGGLFLIRRALSPVDGMIATTRQIEETDLKQRVPITSEDELGRLGRTLNSMLNRIEGAFARQRQFTDDASHELRTPLSVIEAEATLALRRERPAEEYREALVTISEEAISMHRLVDQLLALARGDAVDPESLGAEVVDLGALVSDVAAALVPLAQERGIALSIDAGPVRVEGDPVRLRRLIVNLVENAIRYTEPGGSVTVTLIGEDESAILRVVDTGIGIAPEHQRTVFERFVRLDSSRQRNSEVDGSGLGLAICQQIVQLHGGTIEVESIPRQGSTFTVRLPLHR